MQAAIRQHRANAQRARIQRWMAAAKVAATPDGLVSIKDLVRVFAQVDRGAYSRGYEAGSERARRLLQVEA